MKDCIFCQVAAGQLPSYKVYEDDQVLAFLDIHPRTKGHTLIIPKSHHPNILDTPDELLAKIVVLGKDLAKNYKPILGFDKATFVVVGEDVDHFHYQLIPRYENETFKLAFDGKEKDFDLTQLSADLRND